MRFPQGRPFSNIGKNLRFDYRGQAVPNQNQICRPGFKFRHESSGAYCASETRLSNESHSLLAYAVPDDLVLTEVPDYRGPEKPGQAVNRHQKGRGGAEFLTS